MPCAKDRSSLPRWNHPAYRSRVNSAMSRARRAEAVLAVNRSVIPRHSGAAGSVAVPRKPTRPRARAGIRAQRSVGRRNRPEAEAPGTAATASPREKARRARLAAGIGPDIEETLAGEDRKQRVGHRVATPKPAHGKGHQCHTGCSLVDLYSRGDGRSGATLLDPPRSAGNHPSQSANRTDGPCRPGRVGGGRACMFAVAFMAMRLAPPSAAPSRLRPGRIQESTDVASVRVR